jgi:hypothetical protein
MFLLPCFVLFSAILNVIVSWTLGISVKPFFRTGSPQLTTVYVRTPAHCMFCLSRFMSIILVEEVLSTWVRALDLSCAAHVFPLFGFVRRHFRVHTQRAFCAAAALASLGAC